MTIEILGLTANSYSEEVEILLFESFVGKCFYYYLAEAQLKVANVVTLVVTKGVGKGKLC